MMWKTLLAGTAAAAIVSSTMVYAQQRDDGAPSAPAAQNQQDRGTPPSASGDNQTRGNGRMTSDDRAALAEARVAGRLASLKAGLQLTPDQEKLWPAYESAVRDLIKLHRDRIVARRAPSQRADASGAGAGRFSASATDHLRLRAEELSAEGAALTRLADARQPLFATFDAHQQRRFSMLSRMGRARHHSHRNARDRHSTVQPQRGVEQDRGRNRGAAGRDDRFDDRASQRRGDDWRGSRNESRRDDNQRQYRDRDNGSRAGAERGLRRGERWNSDERRGPDRMRNSTPDDADQGTSEQL